MLDHAPMRDLDPAWSTAVPDWEDRIRNGDSLIPSLPLFDGIADRALEIFKRLRIPDLIGQPTYGEVCEPWVFDFVRVIFGSYDPAARKRLIQEFFLLIPKKNGKSAIAAAIIVTAAIMNDRPMAELVLIAPSHKIASIAFNQARGIIAADPDLAALFHVQSHLKQITHRLTNAVIMILSADGDVVTGSKASFILIDETHVLASKAKAADIMVELRGGLASRPEGFLLQITTQSKAEPAGQFKKELMRARAVRDGDVSLPLLAVLYEFPQDIVKSGAWRDPDTWWMVNPNLEVSVSRDFLIDRFVEAEKDGAEAVALFASQHLNVEIGIGLHSDRWVAADYWIDNADAGLTLDGILEKSDVAVIGGDLGGADDLASLVVMGRCRKTRRRMVWAKAWCISDVLERRKEIAPKLLDLADAGDLVIDDDPQVHVNEMADLCELVRDAEVLPAEAAIGLDPWGVAALLDELMARGFTAEQVLGVGQGYKLSGAIKGIERRLIDGTLVHAGQPIMTWCVGNAKAEARGNNILITKQRAGVAKIDPLIAMFNAEMLMSRNPTPPGGGMRSYFESLEAS